MALQRLQRRGLPMAVRWHCNGSDGIAKALRTRCQGIAKALRQRFADGLQEGEMAGIEPLRDKSETKRDSMGRRRFGKCVDFRNDACLARFDSCFAAGL